MKFFLKISLLLVILIPLIQAATEEHILNFKMNDNVPKGTFIGNIIQRNNITLPAGPYHLIIGSSTFLAFQEFFSLSNNGDIITNLYIDRDNIGDICGPLNCCNKQICDFYANVIFTYYLTKHVVNLKIYFTIEDENDNSPRFSEPKFNINILEGGKTNRISLPTAHDIDSSSNGVYNYSLSGDGLRKFHLSIKNGYPELILLSPLDFENPEEKSYHMILTAFDSGGKYETMNLVVSTVDINDNVPIFVKEVYNISIKENTTYKTPILTVIANDKDSGDNGEIVYKFNFLSAQEVLSKFFFNDTSGEIFLLKILDYENYSEQLIELRIEAVDKGIPQNTGSTKILIRILDINDNFPVIEVLKNNSILENKETTTPILSLYIHDDDTDDNKVKCFKVSGDNFRLDSPQDQSIMVYTDSVYDYENVTLIKLEIRCLDSGVPPLTTTKVLYIAILDENDNYPIFSSKTYHYEVFEDVKVGQFLFEVPAIDRDSGKFGEITYRLDRDGDKFFIVNKTNARVYINNTLDREINSIWQFSVYALDGGGLETSSKISVTVIDINDNRPKLKSKKQLSITENCQINSFVGTIETYDADDDENARVNVDIDMEDNKLFYVYFRLDANRIYVKSLIDREKVSHIYIKIKLVDHGRPKLTTWETITVIVVDENDNDPNLLYPINGETVKLNNLVFVNSEFRSRILSLQARDTDSGENGKVYFKILDNCNGSRYFNVNESLGILYSGWSCRNGEYLSCPIPGIYRLNVELRNGNKDLPRNRLYHFYIEIHEYSESYNIKETVNGNLKNVIILVMVVIFSMLLAVGLVGAIVWARRRPITEFSNCATSSLTNYKKSAILNENMYDPRFFSPDTEVEAHFLNVEKSNFTSGAPPHEMALQKLYSPVSDDFRMSKDFKSFNHSKYSPLNTSPSGLSMSFQYRFVTDGPSSKSNSERGRPYEQYYPSSFEVMDYDGQNNICDRKDIIRREIPDFLKDSKYSKDSWYPDCYFNRDSGHGTNDDSNYFSCVD